MLLFLVSFSHSFQSYNTQYMHFMIVIVLYRELFILLDRHSVTKVTEKGDRSGEDSLYAVVCGGVLYSLYHV